MGKYPTDTQESADTVVSNLKELEDLFDEKTVRKSQIMASMLNGTCAWDYGCYLREQIDNE